MWLFSLVYILIFSGFYLVIGFLNTMYPSSAFISFALFYGIYALGSLIAPYIISKLPFKLVLFLSSFTFLIFIGFAGSYISVLLFIGSIICGFGNSFIWLIQGVYLDENSTGLFYSLFNINMIFGNTLGVIILVTGVSIQIMVLSMLAVSSIGVILTFFVKPNILDVNLSGENNKEKDLEKGGDLNEETPKEGKNQEIPKEISQELDEKNFLEFSLYSVPQKEKEKQKQKKCKEIIYEIFLVFKSVRECYFILGCIVYQAIGLNVTYQILPRLLISNTIDTVYMKSIYNAIIYIVYGVFAMIFSYIWGKLFNKNWIFVVLPYTLLEIACLISIFILAKFNTTPGYWIIIGAVRGCIDYGINNNINISLSKFERKDLFFGLYRFIYSISYLVSSICIGYISYEYVLLLCGSLCLLSSFLYIFFQKYQIS